MEIFIIQAENIKKGFFPEYFYLQFIGSTEAIDIIYLNPFPGIEFVYQGNIVISLSLSNTGILRFAGFFICSSRFSVQK